MFPVVNTFQTGRPLRILGFSYAGNTMLTFNSFLGKAMELSFPERKYNKMIVPKNRKRNDEIVSFLVIEVLIVSFFLKSSKITLVNSKESQNSQ